MNLNQAIELVGLKGITDLFMSALKAKTGVAAPQSSNSSHRQQQRRPKNLTASTTSLGEPNFVVVTSVQAHAPATSTAWFFLE